MNLPINHGKIELSTILDQEHRGLSQCQTFIHHIVTRWSACTGVERWNCDNWSTFCPTRKARSRATTRDCAILSSHFHSLIARPRAIARDHCKELFYITLAFHPQRRANLKKTIHWDLHHPTLQNSHITRSQIVKVPGMKTRSIFKLFWKGWHTLKTPTLPNFELNFSCEVVDSTDLDPDGTVTTTLTKTTPTV